MGTEDKQSAFGTPTEMAPWKRFVIFLIIALVSNIVVASLVKQHYQHFPELDWQGRWDGQTEEAKSSLLAMFVSVPIGVFLIFFGLVQVGRRTWVPFAVGVAIATILNVSLLVVVLMDLVDIEKLSLWFFVTIPVGILAAAIGMLLSLKNHTVVQTFLCLITGTAFAFIVTVFFPFILYSLAMHLKKNRGMKFLDVWSEGPNLYNFLILNVYPIFFQILPSLLFVRRQAKLEKKQVKKKYKKVDNPSFESWIDIAKLRVGDVILTGKESWGHSMKIQASNLLSNGEQNRFWSHATIYSGNGNIIEAQSNGKGVIETDLKEHYFQGDFQFKVLRHDYLSDAELANVVSYCRDKVDQECEYDTWGVTFYTLCALVPPMLSGWLEEEIAGKIFNVDHAYFCSELIAEAFEKQGNKLFARAAWRVKPLDFLFNPIFTEVDCNYERIPLNDSAKIEMEQRMAL